MSAKLKSIPLALMLLVAALVRFINLATPKSLVFDEVYYVDGANDLLAHGVEVDGDQPEFVVHPALGKWLISLGIVLFGDSPFGWRFMTAFIGVLSVGLLYLIALRLFNSEPLALLAGSLLAIDGLAIVMSRTALLDNFLTFFVLLAFYALISERYLLMGIALGAALATKWSGLYFLIAFISLALISSFRKERSDWIRVLASVPIALATYLLSWSGWLFSNRGWDRESDSNPLLALWNYHREIYGFHSTLDVKHPYQSDPISWLVMGRPTSFFYESPKGCGAETCSQEILALGNPILWWLGTISLFALVGYFLTRRDQISVVVLLSFAAGFLPWFLFPDRTMFTFYAVVILPFMILSLTFLARELLTHYTQAKWVVGVVFGAIFVVFLFFLPIQIAQVITYDQWQARMWLESWI